MFYDGNLSLLSLSQGTSIYFRTECFPRPTRCATSL